MSGDQLFDPAAAVARTGLTHDALRYYEREGLIGPIRRSAGGRRLYDEDDLRWIGLVTCLREAGLGIADLRRFAEIIRDAGERADRVGFLWERRAELVERVEQLQRAIAVLDGKIDYWASR